MSPQLSGSKSVQLKGLDCIAIIIIVVAIIVSSAIIAIILLLVIIVLSVGIARSY